MARSMKAAAIRKREKILLENMLVVFLVLRIKMGKRQRWSLFKHFFVCTLEIGGFILRSVFSFGSTTHHSKESDENKSHYSRQNSSVHDL